MKKKGKNVMKIILVCIYLVFTLLGLILMKKGGNPGSFSYTEGTANFGISIVSFAGLVCYLCSFLLFTRIVVMFDLSYIMPLTTGIVQSLTLVSSKIIFKENITTTGIIGAILVICGIVIMNIKVNN